MKKDYYNIVKNIYMNNPKSFHMILKAKKNSELLDWINSQVPLLQDKKYTISTKCYWIFNDIHDFPKCKECGNTFGQNANVDRRGYLTQFCSRKCANNNEITKQHLKDTCYKKYGVSNPAKASCIKEKYQQHMEEKYGVGIKNAWQAKEIQDKSKQTLLRKFGVDNIAKSQYAKDKHKACEAQTVAKRNATKKARGTFNVSKPEEVCYKMLVEKFGKDNIVRQYTSELYPFNCDFYIKSLDLYIEYNGSWTHGKHQFDPTNKDDIEIVEKWKAKNKKYYFIAINTWTKRDVNKRNVAKQNNINIKEFWKVSELEEFLKDLSK